MGITSSIINDQNLKHTVVLSNLKLALQNIAKFSGKMEDWQRQHHCSEEDQSAVSSNHCPKNKKHSGLFCLAHHA
eukprot:2853042-Ditylum_brightwellii.AAC.1